MELEYQNGVRITKLLHETTPLEAAISNYENLAKEHYAKDASLTGTERDKQLKDSLRFLKLERGKLNAIADVQTQLEIYRAAGMAATKGSIKERASAQSNMINESHHPTSVLEKYMRAEGAPKPSPKHTAHHIVPGKRQDQINSEHTITPS